jgi:hypothetical protein
VVYADQIIGKYKDAHERPPLIVPVVAAGLDFVDAYLSLISTAMHLSFPIGLLLAGQAVSLVHEKRQLGALFGTGQGAKVKDIKDVKPRIRPDAKRQLIRYGPFKIPAVTNARNSGRTLFTLF